MYRVVSNREDYGVFADKEEAKQYREELTEHSCFYGSDEYFWIEEEEN